MTALSTMTPRGRRSSYRMLDQALSDLHYIHTRLIPREEEIVRQLIIDAENSIAAVDRAIRRERKVKKK